MCDYNHCHVWWQSLSCMMTIIVACDNHRHVWWQSSSCMTIIVTSGDNHRYVWWQSSSRMTIIVKSGDNHRYSDDSHRHAVRQSSSREVKIVMSGDRLFGPKWSGCKVTNTVTRLVETGRPSDNHRYVGQQSMIVIKRIKRRHLESSIMIVTQLGLPTGTMAVILIIINLHH